MRVGETLTFCLRHVCVKHQRPPSDEGSESRVLLECRAVADIPPWPELAFLSRIIRAARRLRLAAWFYFSGHLIERRESDDSG